ncbi:hypothetical protein ACTMQO_22865 [Escherichia coli]
MAHTTIHQREMVLNKKKKWHPVGRPSQAGRLNLLFHHHHLPTSIDTQTYPVFDSFLQMMKVAHAA